MVFKNPTLSESAFNADSDSVGFLKTTAIYISFIPTDCCLLWQTKRKNGMEEDEFSVCSAPPHTLPQLLDCLEFARIFWRRALPSSGH